jgi:Flp pilus assembly protein TadD
MMNLFRGGEAPWIRKGFDLLMVKKDREALDTFARGLAKEPKDPLGWLGRGMALSRLGDDRKALEIWERKGISLARLGRHEQALSCFEKVVRIEPGDARAWYHKGLSFEALDRPREAYDCYGQALRISDAPEIRERRDAVLSLIRAEIR